MIVDCKFPTSDKNFEKKVTSAKFSIFLLWLISKKGMYGYEIIKTIKSDKAIPSITLSKIYPLLGDLTRGGFISQNKILHGKRAKKVYRLTRK